MRKGQISFVEYIVAFSIFLAFVAYFSFRVLGSMSEYSNEVKGEIIRTEAYQLSELLINDPGEPVNWDNGNSARRFGLSDENSNRTNMLALNKVNQFELNCSGNGYYDVKKLLGSEYDFSILLKNKTKPNGNVLINCYPTQIITKAVNVSVRRIVALNDGSFGELTIQMW